MRLLRGTLALVLSYTLGLQPALAQVQSVRPVAAATSAAGGAAASVTGGAAGLSAPALLGVAPSLLLAPSLAAPVSASVSASAASAPAASATAAPAAPATLAALAAPAAASAPERLAQIRGAADQAVAGIARASGPAAREQAGVQFAALTGELRASAAAGDDDAPRADASGAPGAPRLDKASGKTDGEKAGPPAPKLGIAKVFRDRERNKSFWRYVAGYSLFLLGLEMYVVGMPYLISSITTNALREGKDPRARDPKAVTELIRSNRSLSRIAHWIAQGVSYAAIPLFTRNSEGAGPRKWLVRSFFIRAAVLAAVPAVFFATGVLGLRGSMWVLFGLVAAQSFFQGVSVTTEGAATTRLLGDKSVTPDERTKANSVLTFVGAAIAIIGPLLAGQVARLGPVHGKTGVGGAVIYGIYAGTIALAGLIYSTIKLFGGKDAAAPAGAAAAAPKTLGGTLKSLWTSIRDGLRIVLKDRLLRTMLLMSMMSSLFSDPLVFNVLPEYVETLAGKNGAMTALLRVPVVGWFVKTLIATPMGNFALMVVMASVGSMIATFLIKPLTRLSHKLGFKTDEALTIPFYFIAALEAPLFLLMIHTPFLLGAVALYGLQALAVGFVGIAISGLYQKNLGSRGDGDVNKILAADSLVGIAAAILSTFVYGFVLKGIPIATSLLIAGIATGAVSLIRIAAPFLSFSKDQRRPPAPPHGSVLDEAPDARVPPAHAMPSTGDHNGPNSILSTHL